MVYLSLWNECNDIKVIKTVLIRDNYITRKVAGGVEKKYRNWWLIKKGYDEGTRGVLSLGSISIPKEYVGKKVRFKVELMED